MGRKRKDDSVWCVVDHQEKLMHVASTEAKAYEYISLISDNDLQVKEFIVDFENIDL